jgi:hypothetical protein
MQNRLVEGGQHLVEVARLDDVVGESCIVGHHPPELALLPLGPASSCSQG